MVVSVLDGQPTSWIEGIAGTLAYLSVRFVQEWGIYTSLAANSVAIIPAGIIMVLAIIVLVSAIVGLCGVYHENRCTLGALISLLFFILIVEIVAGSLTYVNMDNIKTDMRENLKISFDAYYDDTLTTRNRFDYMQKRLKCCGVDGPSDWNTTTKGIPDSCCIHQIGRQCSNYPNNVFERGCYNEVFAHFSENLNYIVIIGIGVIIYQVVGMMMSVYLIVVLKRNGYTRMLDHAVQVS